MILHEQKTERKFRFVEDFEEEDFTEGFLEENEKEGPKLTETKFFGSRELHQIARVEWKEVKIIQETETVLPNGQTETKEEEVTFYQEIKGELGGWLEIEANLSQEGDCWVKQDGYVMGEARVCDDAVISGGAEIGDSAFICDKVEIKGPVGIGGKAKICDEAKVTGARRMAVFGSAQVISNSEIGEEAKVYGSARIGSNTVLWGYTRQYSNTIVKGKARVYGHAMILGSVYGNAEVYGRATVYGWVYDDAHVGGTAVVRSSGLVFGKVRLLKGEVLGNLSGEKVDILYPRFYLGAASTYKAKAFEKDGEEDKYDSMSDKEKDKLEDRETKRYGGDVRSLLIKEGSYVEDCEFSGDVTLYGCNLKGCKVADSILGSSFDGFKYDNRNIYYFYGWSTVITPLYYKAMMNMYASECTFDRCIIPSGDFVGSEFEGCMATKGSYHNSDDYYETVRNVSGSKLKNSVLLTNCMGVYDCNFDSVTVDSTSIKGEDLSECGIIQTQGGIRFGMYPLRFLGDLSSKNVLLVLPGKYKEILGSNKWGKVEGVQNLDRIASFVMKFDGVPDKLLFDADQTYAYRMYDDHKYFFSRINNLNEKRSEWFSDIIKNMSAEIKKLSDESKYDEYVPKRKLLRYLEGLVTIGWGILSEDSFNRIKQAVEQTIASFDGVNFTPLVNYGELEMDSSVRDYENKYGISTGFPAFS